MYSFIFEYQNIYTIIFGLNLKYIFTAKYKAASNMRTDVILPRIIKPFSNHDSFFSTAMILVMVKWWFILQYLYKVSFWVLLCFSLWYFDTLPSALIRMLSVILTLSLMISLYLVSYLVTKLSFKFLCPDKSFAVWHDASSAMTNKNRIVFFIFVYLFRRLYVRYNLIYNMQFLATSLQLQLSHRLPFSLI